jgi:hypothetical protein
MKKYILLLSIILVIFQISVAQITIADYSGTDLTNTTNTLPVDVDYHFVITNNGSSDITFIIEVLEFSVPDDGDTNHDNDPSMEVCACGSCTPIISAPVDIGAPTSLDAGDEYGEEGNSDYELADIHYTSMGNTGDAMIKIKVYEQGNTSNFAEFTLSTASGISSINKNISYVYPNPATSNISIVVSEEYVNSKIIFTNLLGKVVFSDKMIEKRKNISVSNFAKGIYFYSIIKNNKIVETKRIIIK